MYRKNVFISFVIFFANILQTSVHRFVNIPCRTMIYFFIDICKSVKDVANSLIDEMVVIYCIYTVYNCGA